MAMTCRDVMKADVECCSAEDTAQHAAQLMRDGNMGFIPICDERKRVMGVVTDRDLAIRLVADNLPATTRLSQLMTREVVGCRPTDPISRAQELMASRKKSRMLVLDADDRLVGVISLSDLAQEGSDGAATLREVSSREVRARA
ncbi:MAG TPA: CBS domain-containing protein [Myxococcales bacterium]|jgi:CBS domain-containing protein|nr:CBS domain-containing protein [Myxococcales bacterium]